jgi:hypothetical protein
MDFAQGIFLKTTPRTIHSLNLFLDNCKDCPCKLMMTYHWTDSTKGSSTASGSVSSCQFHWGLCGWRMHRVCYTRSLCYHFSLNTNRVYKYFLSIILGNQLHPKCWRVQNHLFWSLGKQQAKTLRSKNIVYRCTFFFHILFFVSVWPCLFTLNRETELLKENPLRNFPLSSLR